MFGGVSYITADSLYMAQKRAERSAFENYVADSIFYYAQNKRLTARLYDVLKGDDGESGDEIAARVIKNAGLKVKTGGGNLNG